MQPALRCVQCAQPATQRCRDRSTRSSVVCCSTQCGTRALDALLGAVLTQTIDADPKRTRDDDEEQIDPRKLAQPKYRSPLNEYTRRDIAPLIERWAVHNRWLSESDQLRTWVLASMADPHSLWALQSLCVVLPEPDDVFARGLLEVEMNADTGDNVRPRHKADEKMYAHVVDFVVDARVSGAGVVELHQERRLRVLWNRVAHMDSGSSEENRCRFVVVWVGYRMTNSSHASALLWDRLDGTMLFVEPNGLPSMFYDQQFEIDALLAELERFSMSLRGVRAFLTMAGMVGPLGGPQSWSSSAAGGNRRLCSVKGGFCVSATLLWIDALVRNARPMVPLHEDVLSITQELQRDMRSWPLPPGGGDVVLLGYHSLLIDRFVRTLDRYAPALADAVRRQWPEADLDDEDAAMEAGLAIAERIGAPAIAEMRRVLQAANRAPTATAL